MSGFHYDIVYWKTEDHKNVDFLSRYPLPCKNDKLTAENDDVSCFQNHRIEIMPITPMAIERETSKDDEMRDLCITLQTGKRSMEPELHNATLVTQWYRFQ
jgi:hypothetical protein